MQPYQSNQWSQKMTLDLTPAQFQVLAGLLDQAIKIIGIRAFEDDVVDLMSVVKATAQAAQTPDVEA
jgi:hypothetical protein